jgi:hypothetical protein
MPGFPIQKLLASKKLETKGRKCGTPYFTRLGDVGCAYSTSGGYTFEMNALIYLALVYLAPLPEIETRTLLTGPRCGPETEVLLTERVATQDDFTLITKIIQPDGGVVYSTMSYDLGGVPVHSRQEGQWNNRWNVLDTSFGSSECVQTINAESSKAPSGAKEFANPTSLWFWKTHPSVGTTETVKFLAQNTIATYQIRFKYEGDEELTLAGRKLSVHRVRETPLSAAEGVYTVWWYDDQGMGVKRYHKTTEHEYACELTSWR